MDVRVVNGGSDCEKQETESDTKVAKNILDLFWKVVDIKQNVRIAACVSIIRILLRKQSQHNNKTTEMCSDLQYSVARLVRGMSSAREASRQGFSILLLEILKHFPQVQIEDVLKLIEKHLPVSNRQEKCPSVIGQLLVYSAIIRSGRLLDSPHLSLVLKNLYCLSHDRSYIQEAVYKLMVHMFDGIEAALFKVSVLPTLKDEMNCGWEKASADNMWLLLLVARKFPATLTEKFMKKHWEDRNLLSEDTIHHWKKIIKQSTVVHPYMHPVCHEFLQLCFQEKALKFAWTSVMDEGLFETDQSEKTYLGFLMVKEALTKVEKKKLVKVIMSPKFCSALSRSYVNTKNPLNFAASTLVSFLSQYMEKAADAQLQMAVLKPLLLVPNTIILCKRKEVTAMISHLKTDAAIEFGEQLKSLVFERTIVEDADEEDESSSEKDKMQICAITQIGLLISHPSILSELEWRRNTLKFLFTHSFYVVTKPIDDLPEIFKSKTTEWFTENMRTSFKKCFVSALDSMNLKSSLSQRLETLLSLVEFWDHMIELESKVTPLFDANKVQESWKRIRHLTKKLKCQRDKGDHTIENGALNLFMLQLGFQLFFDEEKIPSILEELEVCCEKLITPDSGSSESDVDHPWLQVFVDILLSLLSDASHHVRNIVHTAFRFICPFINLDALRLIFDVIAKDDDSAIDDDEEEDEGSDEDIKDEDQLDDKATSSDDSSDDDDDDDDDAPVDNEFKLKIQNALGSIADLGEDEEEVILSDSEMFKLDKTLSAAFLSQRKVGPKDITPEKKALVEFKIRCLDLLLCYLKAKPSPNMNSVLKCVKPVFSAYEFSHKSHHYNQLSGPATNALKQISLIRKFKNTSDVDASELSELLEFLFSKLQGRTMPKDIKLVVCSLCNFIMLCDRKLNPEFDQNGIQDSDSPCMKLYLEALGKFLQNSSCRYIPELFSKLMALCPGYAWVMLEFISRNAFGELKSLYRLKETLKLVFSAMQFAKGYQHASEKQWNKIAKHLTRKFIQESVNMKDKEYAEELLRMLLTLNEIIKEKFLKSGIESYPDLHDLLLSMPEEQFSNKGKIFRQKLILLTEGTKD